MLSWPEVVLLAHSLSVADIATSRPSTFPEPSSRRHGAHWANEECVKSRSMGPDSVRESPLTPPLALIPTRSACRSVRYVRATDPALCVRVELQPRGVLASNVLDVNVGPAQRRRRPASQFVVVGTSPPGISRPATRPPVTQVRGMPGAPRSSSDHPLLALADLNGPEPHESTLLGGVGCCGRDLDEPSAEGVCLLRSPWRRGWRSRRRARRGSSSREGRAVGLEVGERVLLLVDRGDESPAIPRPATRPGWEARRSPSAVAMVSFVSSIGPPGSAIEIAIPATNGPRRKRTHSSSA